MNQLPVRKPNRLKEYDYSTPGAYFLTVCTRDRRRILSRIEAPPDGAVGEGLAPPAVLLYEAGALVEKQIRDLPDRFENLFVDRFVIMPNHIHLLLSVSYGPGGASPSPTDKTDVTAVIGTFKSLTTRLWHTIGGTGPLWQRSYYDHVIRGEDDYRAIAEYIDANPARWREDEFYTEI